MAFWYNKPGQGYWTRTISLLGAMVLVVAGAIWIRSELEAPLQNNPNAIYIGWGVAAMIMLVFGGLLIWVLNKPRIVEFMIATEAEMKKVNWPSRQQTIKLTLIVIAVSVIVGLYIGGLDFVFTKLIETILKVLISS